MKVNVDSSYLYIVGNVPNQTGSTVQDDAYVRKYDLGFNEIWTKQFGSSSSDSITGLASYASNIFVVGSFGSNNPFVSKLDATNGNIIWTITPSPPSGGTLKLESVVVDSTGVYVIGSVVGVYSGQSIPPATSGDSNAVIRKYDFNGSEVWTREFGAGNCCLGDTGDPDPNNPGSVFGHGIALDNTGVYSVGGLGSGTIFGAAIEGDSDSGISNFMRKYDKDGNYLWTKQFGYTGRYTSAYDVVAYSGQVYVTGGISFGPGYTRASDTNGDMLWVSRLGGLNRAIDAGSKGVYFGGFLEDYDGPNHHGTLGKFQASGDAVWFRYVTNYDYHSREDIRDVAVSSQFVYVVGSTDTGLYGQPGNGHDFIMRIGTDDRTDKTDFNGDGYADLVVGVPREDIGSIMDAGGVNVIYGSSNGLSATAKPDQFISQDTPNVENNAEAGDQFGSSVATGDFNNDGYSDIAIGVPKEDIGTVQDAGGVSIIYGSPSGLSATAILPDQFWTQNKLGSGGNSEAGDNFGFSLATGDYDNDGYSDLAIGAPYEDIGTIVDAGGVNVIYGSTTGLSTTVLPSQFWQQNTSIDSSETNDYFGWSLATFSESIADGFDDLAIGAYGEDNEPVIDDGAVYAIFGSFNGLSTAILHPAKYLDSFADENGVGYGFSLASGDFYNRGQRTLVAGIPFADVGTSADAGRIRATSVFTQDSPDDLEGIAEAGDRFGYSLAVGDFNNDNYDDLAVGVPYEDIGTIIDAGSVNVIYGSKSGLQTINSANTGRADQGWQQDTPFVEGAAEAGDNFGFSLRADDFNNDGKHDLAVGVPGEDIGTISNAGMINLIYGSSTGLSATSVPDQIWHQDSPNVEGVNEAEDAFATSVA